MRNASRLVLLLLLFGSCYKADNSGIPKGQPTFTITVSGVSIADSAMTFQVNDSSSFGIDLSFNIIAGYPSNYPITCYISNLPNGITALTDSFVFKLNGRPSFSLTVNADTGIYYANINVATVAGALKTYPIRIHVLPVPDCAPGLAGSYTGSDACGHFSIGDIWYSYTASITAVPGQPHWISITNFKGLGDSIIVYATVNCGGGVDIPVQTTKGYTIFGRGKGYSGLQENGKPWISIYGDTVIHAGDTQTCYTQLKR